MKRIFMLAWRYVAFHKARSAIMIVCLSLTFVLPLSAHLLISRYGEGLVARAQATPLVAGSKGNRFDLVLKALYFSSARLDPIYMSEVGEINESGLATAIPLHLGFTARNFPIVGTTPEYFDCRGIKSAAGQMPTVLGQVAVGATVARELDLEVGDYIFSDQQNLYDIAKAYPLKMSIVGIMTESGTPDDRAVFVNVQTAWIIEGIVHGHRDVKRMRDESIITKRDDKQVVTNASIVEYNEVTPENIDEFHHHASPDQLPLSAIICFPEDAKSATLLKARYNLSETNRMLVPETVINELLGLVFKIKTFFDANFALLSLTTVLFVALVVLLSRRLREREMKTMFRLGCSRRMTFFLQVAELVIMTAISIVASVVISLTLVVAALNQLHLS